MSKIKYDYLLHHLRTKDDARSVFYNNSTSGIPATNVQDAIDSLISGSPSNVDYANTIFVDPNGSASEDGKNPASPTTFANALSNLVFGTNVVLSEGIYTIGGPITISQSNITISTIQGGTGSNSTIISDDFIIGAGITRFRAHGVRFDGDVLDNGSDGRHYFSWCSLGATATFGRVNPNRWCDFYDCDLQSGTFSITGVGANNASTLITGSSSITGTKTLSATNHFTRMFNNATSGGATLTNGSLEIEECDVIGGANVINASAGTAVILYNTHIKDAGGTPQPITLAGNYNYQNTVFDIENSTLSGTAIKTNTSHWTGPIQASNHWHDWTFSDPGSWTVGNFLSTGDTSTLHARFAPRKIEFFELDFFNDNILTSATEVEIVQDPFDTPVVLETIQFNGNSGSIIQFTPFQVAKFTVIGIRLKTAGETPSNILINLRFRVLD